MGKNLPAKKYTMGEPTHRHLRYILDHTVTDGMANNDSHFIDLALGLSAVNRRAYRQGLYYYVNSVTVHDSNQNVWTKFATAADTWYTKQAWIRGFRAWSKMNSEAVESGDDLDIAGQYSDFKIWLSENHYDNNDGGFGNLLVPIGSQDYNNAVGQWSGNFFDVNTDFIQQFAIDHWDYSKFNHLGNDHYITLFGEHQAVGGGSSNPPRYSLMKGYGDTRRSVPDEDPILPEEISTDLLAVMFEGNVSQTEDVIENLENQNDGAPYHNDYYGIQETVIVSQTANSGGAGAVTRAPGFVVPFGLLEIITNSSQEGKVEVVIELAAGKYNGVAAARVC